MWTSEWIALGYFSYLALVSWLRPIGARRRGVIGVTCVLLIAAIWSIAAGRLPQIRPWAPLAYILIGYYASGCLFIAPSPAFESWLIAWDRWLLGDPSRRFARWPRPVLAFLEIIYMGCFILIGAGFLILILNGHDDAADRYWTLVTAAELGSFAPLAFIQARPPWALEPKPVLTDRFVHDLASGMTQHFTIRVNTFPSGHVAGSLAVAIAVMTFMPRTGIILLALALGIAVATVVGRYHFVIDALAGAALTAAIWTVTLAAR